MSPRPPAPHPLDARPPADEQEAIKRRKVMRKARSNKKRPALLASLELRYLNHA